VLEALGGFASTAKGGGMAIVWVAGGFLGPAHGLTVPHTRSMFGTFFLLCQKIGSYILAIVEMCAKILA